MLCGWKTALSIHCASLWPVNSIMCVHEVCGGCSSLISKVGHTRLSLLDDWLIRGYSRMQVQWNIRVIWTTCQAVGPLINEEKSMLRSVQSIKFISTVLDSTQARAFLPEARFLAILDLVARVSAQSLTTVRVCLSLLRHMAACIYVVQYARLHVRPLQMWLASMYFPSRHHLDMIIIFPLHVLISLLCWTRSRPVLRGDHSQSCIRCYCCCRMPWS